MLRIHETAVELVAEVMPLLEAGGLDPPWVRDLAAATRESEPLLRTALARLARTDAVQAVVKDLYYPAPTLARAARYGLTVSRRTIGTRMVGAAITTAGGAAPSPRFRRVRDYRRSTGRTGLCSRATGRNIRATAAYGVDSTSFPSSQRLARARSSGPMSWP